MNYEFFIARRYIFSKKSHNAINIISGISVVGVAVATMALVCTLSVFNGFHDLVASLFTAFDPQLRITLAEGSTIQANDSRLQKVKKLDCVAVYTPVMEGQAMVVLNGQQHVVTIMGVADNFSKQTHIEDILYGEGSFGLHADVLEYGVVGLQLAAKMNLNIDFTEPLQVYAPKRGERVNMANPLSSFNHQELQSPGVVFQVQQSKYDANYIITSLGFAQRLFDYQGRISSAEVKLKKGTSLSQAKKEIKALLGDTFVVQDRYEQQDDVFRIMRIEKLISYLFLTFILLVACFNIIGSLSMLMIEKKHDVQTLRSMGATDRQICNIFMFEGRMISLAGAVVGLLLGLLLCWLQQQYGFITMGESEGSFIVEAYPVSVHPWDLVLIFVTVLLVGWAAVWYPVRYLSKNLL
ncbi:MAG: ABC transporter permease [Bacteroidaceae bacterium]|nr:ABC transporter permease [Bacteroidaceae bacterium]MBR1901774.1 ABC transporter permease [Bacteroidaceae bacterium]